MKVKTYRTFVGDFETTVYDGQTDTEVWASAMVELFTDDVKIFHSIQETFDYIVSLNDNIKIYYHNLKFDGSFWLSFLMTELEYKQAYTVTNKDPFTVEWLHEKDMPNKSFKYSISHMGQWYTIIIKVRNHYIEIRDSLKLLPFSVKRIGESFGTAHKKLDMEYTGYRYAGCTITDEEKSYIANDVLVVKEALEIMVNENHTQLTIGSCCLDEFKKTLMVEEYKDTFPDMYSIEIDENLYGYPNAGEYIRKSYHGGWCYLVKGKENKIYHNGITLDVNSLYPSMMSSESGNKYPIGKPKFWKGDIPDDVKKPNKYFFVRLRCRFKIKKDKLPFIQIKGSFLYKSTEALETSDIWDNVNKRYIDKYIGLDGQIHSSIVELVLTQTDYYLLLDHYDLYDLEILDGCWFYNCCGVFDIYIDKYKKIKMESKGAKRELAKLFLNNLYGKMASSKDSSFKVAYLKDDLSIQFVTVNEHNKTAGYIPIGSAITSYSRNFTIRHAQANYYGKDKAGFIYADTDSIHCDLPFEQIKKCKVDDVNFCCWKPEAQWDDAIFTRQKTYIEHVVAENLKPIENPYYNIKCAGMPKRCKDLFELSMRDNLEVDRTQYNQEEIDFLKIKRTLEDFKTGLTVPSKLMPKRIKGGTLLVETTFEMRGE